MMERRFAARVAAVAIFVGLFGCSASGNGTSGLADEGGGSGGTGAGGISGTGGVIPQGGGGTGMRDPSDTRDLPVRKKTCDASGQNCTCLRLALLGTLVSAANDKDTQPFVDWLNGNSGGTATVTMVTTKPTVDAAFLANYDVLLVANVNGWSFSAAEKEAVHTWMLETGGGLISLTGFDSMSGEPAATSQLIESAGFSYQATRTAEGGQGQPVFFEGGTQDLKNCLAWSGQNSAVAIITAPIKFTPQTGPMEKLTFELDYVGAYIGWAVTAPLEATVLATDPVTGMPMATALEVERKGRILAFGDEWVIFKNQWEPSGNPPNQTMDQYNICWNQAGMYFHSVRTLYQTKQFWYNAVNYVAPPNECNFIIDDPDVVVR